MCIHDFLPVLLKWLDTDTQMGHMDSAANQNLKMSYSFWNVLSLSYWIWTTISLSEVGGIPWLGFGVPSALLNWTLELSLLLRFRVFVKGKQTLYDNVHFVWSFGLWLEPKLWHLRETLWSSTYLGIGLYLWPLYCVHLMLVPELPCRDWAALLCILHFCHLISDLNSVRKRHYRSVAEQSGTWPLRRRRRVVF